MLLLWQVPPLQAPPSPSKVPATAWQPALPKAPQLRLGHVGLIQRWGLNYLRLVYYADPKPLVHRPPGIFVLEVLMKGQVWCGYELTLMEGISAARRRDTLLDQFRRHWPGPFNPQRPAVVRFLAAVNFPLDPGDTMTYLFDPAGVLHFRSGRRGWVSISDPELTQAFRHLTYVGDPDNQDAIAALRRGMETAFRREAKEE